MTWGEKRILHEAKGSEERIDSRSFALSIRHGVFVLLIAPSAKCLICCVLGPLWRQKKQSAIVSILEIFSHNSFSLSESPGLQTSAKRPFAEDATWLSASGQSA